MYLCPYMARIFITGSADGLGQLSAAMLLQQGHDVVLHARNTSRGKEALEKTPTAKGVLIGDLASIEETIELASQANQSGVFDAVIHNAGVNQTSARQIFAVNTCAPYILTCLMKRPKRLIYLTSGMHLHGQPNFEQFKRDTSGISYSDSKLHVVMLAMAVARKWKGVYSNAVNPGWVPTKMGGRNAPDDLQKGLETQSWLAVSHNERALVSGQYFFHQRERSYNRKAADVSLQEEFLARMQEVTGVAFPDQ